MCLVARALTGVVLVTGLLVVTGSAAFRMSRQLGAKRAEILPAGPGALPDRATRGGAVAGEIAPKGPPSSRVDLARGSLEGADGGSEPVRETAPSRR